MPYLKYLLNAKTKHDIHSPFVFDFVTHVLNDKGMYSSYQNSEKLRMEMLKDSREIAFKDLGTGADGRRSISDIAGKSLIAKKYGRLLFRITNYYRPANILELGTSLGLSTLYMAGAGTARQIVTIEGSEEVGRVAQDYFSSIQYPVSNIQFIIGNLDHVLEHAIKTLPSLDLVFFDANHRYEPTIRYFTACLSKKTENSIFIFDDINWSAGMRKAWNEIKAHPEVTVTIDLFRMGLVFFPKSQAKEHFTIRF